MRVTTISKNGGMGNQCMGGGGAQYRKTLETLCQRCWGSTY